MVWNMGLSFFPAKATLKPFFYTDLVRGAALL